MRTNGYFASLVTVLLAFFVGSSEAAVKCQIRAGTGCGGPVIYEMQLCAVITFNQGDCVNQCVSLAPICNVSGFDSWVNAYVDLGRNGIHGDLIQNSDAYDDAGNLTYTSEKTYSLCLREKTMVIGNYSSPKYVKSAACPRVLVPSPDTCRNGTVYDPLSRQCIIDDPSCGTGGNSTITSVIKQGAMMVSVQDRHFSTNSKIDPTQFAISADTSSAATTGTQTPTKDLKVAASMAVSNPPIPKMGTEPDAPGRKEVATEPAPLSFASSAGGGAGVSAAPPAKKSERSLLASTYLEKTSGVPSAGVTAGGEGADSGDGTRGEPGASWFGPKTATPGDGAGAQIGFDSVKTSAPGTDVLRVEDPADYFLKSEMDTSLFKRVTAQCRKKEKEFILSQ